MERQAKLFFHFLAVCYLFIFCGFFLKNKTQTNDFKCLGGEVAHEFMQRKIIKLSNDNVLQNNGRKHSSVGTQIVISAIL